jgi:hypothetical protein
MKRACILLFVTLTALSVAQSTAIKEAREVSIRGEKVGRGLVAQGVLEDGVHWYFSQTSTDGRQGTAKATTSIESWCAPDGTPLRAKYIAATGDMTKTTELFVRGNEVRIVETTEAKGRPKTQVLSTLHADPGTVLQFSQFNPRDVPIPENRNSVDLTIIEPVALQAVRANLSLVALQPKLTDGVPTGAEYLYRLRSGPRSVSMIRVDDLGRFRYMENDKAMTMRPTKMTDDESTLLDGIVQKMEKG